MAGISSSFAVEATTEKFDFDGKIKGISFKKIMFDTKDSLMLPLPQYNKKKLSEEVPQEEALEEDSGESEWYNDAPGYDYNDADGTGYGWPLSEDKEKKWKQILDINKVTKKEKNDVYVCKFQVKYIMNWEYCYDLNPQTNPGQCGCWVSWQKDGEWNTGKCEWKSKLEYEKIK